MTPEGNESSYPATGSTTINIVAGVDRLDPTTVSIDSTVIDDLISELQSEIKSNNQTITFTYDEATAELTGKIGNDIVLLVNVDATQDVNNGHDVDIKITITQYEALDHTNTGDSTGYITSNNDKINISVPVQIKDSDGDQLTNSVEVDLIIIDGTDPVISAPSTISVNESALDGNLNFHAGSDSNSDTEIAEGQITIDTGSDSI